MRREYLDVDKNLGTALVVVPIAAMATMLNKRMMVVLAVNPALVIMVIGQGASSTGSDKENGQTQSQKVFLIFFHFPD